MKVVILTGNQGNQKALCNKIAEVCEVAAIVLSDNIPRKKPSALRRAHTFINRVGNRNFAVCEGRTKLHELVSGKKLVSLYREYGNAARRGN